MIVQCPNCRARFRVADEKVPDKGVKVRCTKCANVFKVTRADAVDAAPPKSASVDAFGLDAPPTPLPGAGGRRSNAFDLGEPTPAPPSDQGRISHSLPPTVSFTYGAASPSQSLDLDLSLGPPQGQRPPQAPPPAYAPPPPPSRQSGSAIDAALDAALASGGDPFGDLGLSNAPQPPPPPRPTTSPGHDPFADVDFGSVAPAHQPPPSPPQAYAAPGPGDDPFAVDFSHAEPPPPPPPPQPARAARPARPPTPTPQPAAAPPPLDDPFAQPSNPEPDPFGDPAPPAEPPPESPPDAPSADELPAEAAPAEAPAKPRQASSAREIDFGESSIGPRLDLDYAAVGIEKPPAQVGIGRVARAAGETSDRLGASPETRVAGRARVRNELASAAFNVASAFVVAFAALVVVATLRTPRPLTLDDLGFPVVWLALGFGDGTEQATLHTSRLRTGVYATRNGGELFYVAGDVENSAREYDALHVSVEVLRAGRLLARGDAVASVAATPEDLYTLDSRRNEDLQKLLGLRRSLADLKLHPGERAPFIAVFPLSTDELSGAEVRTSVVEGLPPALREAFQKPVPAEQPQELVPQAPDFMGPPAVKGGTGPGLP